MAQEVGENTAAFEAHFAFHRERRPRSYWLLIAVFMVGVALSIACRQLLHELAHGRALRREPPVPQSLLLQGVKAYESQDFSAAVAAFRRVLEAVPNQARALDYLDRIELTKRDAERLGKAEEALVAGQPERAMRLALVVPPSSPLFAQAEVIARTAGETHRKQTQAPSSAEARTSKPPALTDAKAALLEVLALYQAAKFGEAVARAKDLARKAQGETRAELERWAVDAERFAAQYQSLPRDSARRARHAEQVYEAVLLDEHLSDGHYARGLRAELAPVLIELAQAQLRRGDVRGGCLLLRQALHFDARDGASVEARERCEDEARARLQQADRAAAREPALALKLYREAYELAIEGGPTFEAAERGMESKLP